MKKAMKKLMAALLAVAMVCAMAIPAWAAPATNGSITVKNTVDGKTYNIYKILDLETNGTGEDESTYTAFKYKAATGWETFVKGSAYLKPDADGYVTWKDADENADDVKAFSKLAKEHAETLSSVRTKTADSTGSVTFTGLELGYYLITSNVDTSNDALCMLSTTKPSVTVQEKNGAPSVEKEVKENSTQNWGKVNDANIGDTVEFKTTINVTDGDPKDYILHDTMSTGLALNKESIKVARKNGDELTPSTDYTVEIPGTGTDKCTFEIHFINGQLKTNDVIEVTYSARVTKDAVIAGEGNPNDTILEYNNKTSTKSTTTTYVWQFDILKYTVSADSAHSEIHLEGAKFIVYRGSDENIEYAKFGTGNKFESWVSNSDEATVLTTPADGKIALTGLDSGTYKLEEIEAPKGYNKLTAPITFTITNASDAAKKGTVSYTSNDGTTAIGTIKVLNNAGTTLPGTGGIGTTIFYVIGGGLMVAAAILLITKKRMENR